MKAKNFNEALLKRLDKGELKKLETQARIESESLEILRDAVTNAIAKHVERNDMGFNEFTRQLGVSPSQAAKIRKGEANLTLASVAHIAAFLGKKPRLVFE